MPTTPPSTPTAPADEVIRRVADALDRDCGLPWPASGFFYDLETTGFSHDRDLIVEWGHALVHDAVVVDRNDVVLNWLARPDLVPAHFVEGQLARVAQAMRDQDRPWSLTPRRLRDEGADPHEVLAWVYDLLAGARDKGLVTVTHNGLAFDNVMLANAFARDLGRTFEFDRDRVMDTGCLIKAMQLAALGHRDAYPRRGERLSNYFTRIKDWRAKGVFYSLDRYAVPAFGIDTDASLAHTAGEDAFVLTLLVAEIGRRIARAPAPAAPPVSPPVLIAANKPPPAADVADDFGAPSYRRQRNR